MLSWKAAVTHAWMRIYTMKAPPKLTWPVDWDLEKYNIYFRYTQVKTYVYWSEDGDFAI